VIYNEDLGKKILYKYLDSDKRGELRNKLKHSEDVGRFAFIVAERIKNRSPEMVDFNSEFVGFLGLVHDIGINVSSFRHEFHTIDLLIDEGAPRDISVYSMHGQVAEQFGGYDDDKREENEYLPIGLEGKILTYADMSVNTWPPVSIEERISIINDGVNQVMDRREDFIERGNDILKFLNIAYPRYKRYEAEILQLSEVDSYNDFL
jgi:hypothetical protein